MTFRQLDLTFASILKAVQGGICDIHSVYLKDFIFWKDNKVAIFREKTVYGPFTQHLIFGYNLLEAEVNICGCFKLNKDIYVWDHQGCVFKLEIPALKNEDPVWSMQKIFCVNSLKSLKSFKDRVAVLYSSDSNSVLQLYSYGQKWWESPDFQKTLPGQMEIKEMLFGSTKLKLSFITDQIDFSADAIKDVIILNYGHTVDILYLDDKLKKNYSLYKTENVCEISSIYCMEDGVAIVLDVPTVIWVTGTTYTEYLHIALPCEPKSLISGCNIMLCTDGVYLWRCRPERKLVTERFRSYFIWFMSSYKVPIYGASSVTQILQSQYALVSSEYGDCYFIDFTKVIDDDMTVVGRISGKFSGNWHKNCQTRSNKSGTNVFNFQETYRLLEMCKFYEERSIQVKETIIAEEEKLAGLSFIALRNIFTPYFKTLIHVDRVLTDITSVSKTCVKNEYNLIIKVINTYHEDFSPIKFQFYATLRVNGTTYSRTVPAVLKKGCFTSTSVSFIMKDFSIMPEFQCFILFDSQKYDITFAVPLMNQILDISYFIMPCSSSSSNYKHFTLNDNIFNPEERNVCFHQSLIKHYILKVLSIEEFSSFLHQIVNMRHPGKRSHFSKQVDMKGDVSTFQQDEDLVYVSDGTSYETSDSITRKISAKTCSSPLDNHSHILMMKYSSFCGTSSFFKDQIDAEEEANFFGQYSKDLNDCNGQLKNKKKQDPIEKFVSQESCHENFQKDKSKMEELKTPLCLCIGSVFIYVVYCEPNIIDISSTNVEMLHTIKDFFLKHIITSYSVNVRVCTLSNREILHTYSSLKKYTLLEIEALHKKLRKLVNDLHSLAVS